MSSSADEMAVRFAPDSDAAVDAGSFPRTVPVASPSPLDTPTVSGEDDDYRSETSSEATGSSRYGRGGYGSSSGAAASDGSKRRKQTTTAYSNHRDLSHRLKRAVYNATENVNFDESLIGADVVLCVKNNASHFGASSATDTDTDADTDALASSSPPVSSSSPPSPSSSPSPRHTVKRFHAHRFMLAASSEPFRAMLTGRMREASERDVEIHGVDPHVVEKMLLFIYTGDVVLDMDSVVGLLIAAEMYELAALREICKSFVLYHAHEVFRNPQIVELPEKLLLEIIENDELQIRELPLLEALVQWGRARVANADSTPLVDILSDVMEHVRFGTMSVSDLYGKVRVLVRDGVVRECLLTEALFHHLKWGTPSGRASQRMKPRALAAALRKRKRVSFIQHVSFHE